MPYPGKMIAFEGIDGSGKTTQAKWLYHYLTCILPCPVFRFAEPRIPCPHGLSPEEQLEYYLSDRHHNVKHDYLPILNAGGIIICDRYTASTIAYQQYGAGLDGHTVRTLCQNAEQGVSLDLILWLDVPVIEAQARVMLRDGERPTDESTAFLRRVHDGYKAIARENKLVRRICASLDEKLVWRAVQEIVDEWLINTTKQGEGRSPACDGHLPPAKAHQD